MDDGEEKEIAIWIIEEKKRRKDRLPKKYQEKEIRYKKRRKNKVPTKRSEEKRTKKKN